MKEQSGEFISGSQLAKIQRMTIDDWMNCIDEELKKANVSRKKTKEDNLNGTDINLHRFNFFTLEA